MTLFNDLANKLSLPLSTGPTAPGFRSAQLGAIHAICGHFWDKTRPALVVMPTGSGKTAVMMAASILLRSSRVLIVAPSRLLRDQIVENFSTLDQLRAIGAIDLLGNSLKVHGVSNKLVSKAMWKSLRKSEVVVGTPFAISPGIEGVFPPPSDLFDTVIFDEAHHVPARSYSAIAEAFPEARQVLFTATPFRRDEREIRGDLIFTYDLAQAKRDGIFGKLRYVPVEPMEGQNADEAIARAAAEQIKLDRQAGLMHRLIVRASSLVRADELAGLYERCTKLRLKRVHSGLSAKSVRKAVQELRSGELDGVITVDMLGEGFDLPHLKVAALHSPHKSLAVTLQFIGRFARTKGPEFGDATFFAVPREVTGEAKRLFVPGAEWNEIVEDLSHQRLAEEQEIRATITSFGPVTDTSPPHTAERDRIQSQLWSLRPFFHAKIYEVLGPVNLDASLSVPPSLEPLLIQRSKKEHTLIWVGRATTPLRWSNHEGWADIAHELFLVAHVPSARLLFVCTTRRENAVFDAIVDSVAGDAHRRLAPDEINRVLRNIENPEFFSVGMRNRAGVGGAGAESYRMLAGRSADKAIRAVDGSIYDQGHAFCRGTEGGKEVTIGFSTGSKVWTNRMDQLPELLRWLRHIAGKIHDPGKASPRSMFDKLGVASRITELPRPIIAADLPPEAYTRPTSQVHTDQGDTWLVDIRVHVMAQTSTSANLVLRVGSTDLDVTYDLLRRPHLSSTVARTIAATLIDANGRHHDTLLAFLNEYPPVLYLEDLSSVSGDTISSPPSFNESTIAEQIEGVDWVGVGADPLLEKPGSIAGPLKSLFEYMEERLAREGAEIIFADDSSNEIADYVAVFRDSGQIRVQLVHCKAASKRPIPGDRTEELYEVLSQAVKCRRWLDTRQLTRQIKHRLDNTKMSHFVVGDLQKLSALLHDTNRVAFEIVVVQPALSTNPKPTVRDLLNAVDAYQRGAGRLPLRFIGTHPSA